MGRSSVELGQVAERAVADVRTSLRQHYPDLDPAVFHYGAVDIDPGHLVIWVLLDCPDEVLPPWCFNPGIAEDRQIDAALRVKLLEIQQAVRTVLAAHEWPNPHEVRVGFDTRRRVRDGGGWSYFK